MKEFILRNFRKFPVPTIAVVLLYLYINELTENREDYRNCQADLKRKDIELSAAAERERKMNEQLLEFAFEIRMHKRTSDSTLRKGTERNVNKLLKR